MRYAHFTRIRCAFVPLRYYVLPHLFLLVWIFSFTTDRCAFTTTHVAAPRFCLLVVTAHTRTGYRAVATPPFTFGLRLWFRTWLPLLLPHGCAVGYRLRVTCPHTDSARFCGCHGSALAVFFTHLFWLRLPAGLDYVAFTVDALCALSLSFTLHVYTTILRLLRILLPCGFDCVLRFIYVYAYTHDALRLPRVAFAVVAVTFVDSLVCAHTTHYTHALHVPPLSLRCRYVALRLRCRILFVTFLLYCPCGCIYVTRYSRLTVCCHAFTVCHAHAFYSLLQFTPRCCLCPPHTLHADRFTTRIVFTRYLRIWILGFSFYTLRLYALLRICTRVYTRLPRLRVAGCCSRSCVWIAVAAFAATVTLQSSRSFTLPCVLHCVYAHICITTCRTARLLPRILRLLRFVCGFCARLPHHRNVWLRTDLVGFTFCTFTLRYARGLSSSLLRTIYACVTFDLRAATDFLVALRCVTYVVPRTRYAR